MINPESELAHRFWEEGKVPDCPIIDFHAHIGEWRGIYLPRGSGEGMLRTMDQAGVRLAIFCGHEDLFAPSLKNAYNIERVRRHPDRFRAYLAVNPNHSDPKEDIALFRRHREVFVGFKTLPSYFGYPLTHDRYRPYWEFAQEENLLVLCHTWEGSPVGGPEEVEKFMRQYPGVTFIAGHSLHRDWDAAARMAREFPNLYLDLCAVMDDRGVLELFVERAGSHKILFGTDLPWFDPHYYIGAILSADISDEAMRDIFYRNGERILSRFRWFPEIWGKG